jgi:hypothetical protein
LLTIPMVLTYCIVMLGVAACALTVLPPGE